MSTPSGHGGQTSPRQKIIFQRNLFSKSYKTHLYKNPNKDLKSVERPYKVDKFKLDRKIFSGEKIKKELVRWIRTQDLTRNTIKSFSIYHKKFFSESMGYF